MGYAIHRAFMVIVSFSYFGLISLFIALRLADIFPQAWSNLVKLGLLYASETKV